MKCTWKDCNGEARHPLEAKDGEVWGNLCDAHFKRHDDSLGEANAKRILSNWVKAKGGSQKATKRLLG